MTATLATPAPASEAERRRVDAAAAAAHRAVLAERSDAPGLVASAGVEHLRRLVRRADPLLADRLVDVAVAQVGALAAGLGRLDPLLADDAVSEIMVNGDGRVWVERDGLLCRTDDHLATDEVLTLMERITAPLGLHVDRRNPIVDARLADGSRVSAVVPPLSVDGPCLTIRRFRVRTVHLADLCAPDVEALLTAAVAERRNVVVSGGTGAGKTTLLNALGALLPDGERIVTVEDTAELRLPGDHVVRLEARSASADGVGQVTIAELVRAALRMRPDRIIVGECRGNEALAMLQAMNTGHEGSMSTCHANAPTDALRRLETMVVSGMVALPLSAVRDQVRAAVDLVVQVARVADGRRQIVAVAEVEPDGANGDDAVRTRALVVDGRVVAETRRPSRARISGPAPRRGPGAP